ncbi:MAG: heat-inducible transcriptional repressor HrcA [Bacilli bacterium]|nr:heat-inducible transcriptional repressor HrcA [Bacilli bacterium]
MTRSEMILKMIVEHFIKTAQPVGSQTLLDEYKLDYSSATIRAEMNSLEKAGYLEKTHTSSGRVPSKKGYQYYVEHLREQRLDDSVKYALASILEKKAQSVEEVMAQSCEILSSMTDLATVVLGPKTAEEHLVSVQIIPIGKNTATAVFVTDQGYVENKTFVIEDKISMEDLTKTVSVLNERLKGTAVSDLVPKMEAMKPAVTDMLVGQDVIYQVMLQAFMKFATERVSLYGKSKIMEQPEFSGDIDKLKEVLGLIDDPEKLRKALIESAPSASSEGVDVRFGKDSDLAIVSAEVNVPGANNATLSLVGPSRMDYDKAMETLRVVCEMIGQYFQGGGGDDSSGGDHSA